MLNKSNLCQGLGTLNRWGSTWIAWRSVLQEWGRPGELHANVWLRTWLCELLHSSPFGARTNNAAAHLVSVGTLLKVWSMCLVTKAHTTDLKYCTHYDRLASCNNVMLPHPHCWIEPASCIHMQSVTHRSRCSKQLRGFWLPPDCVMPQSRNNKHPMAFLESSNGINQMPRPLAPDISFTSTTNL